MKNNPDKTAKDPSAPKFDKIDSSAGRFRDKLSKEAWVPGLIEVVFRNPDDSGVRDWNFEEEYERRKPSKAWPDDLTKTLLSHGLVSWKPSFPLRYPWSTDSPEKAREIYHEAGRDKFVSLSFSPAVETRRIAAEIRDLPEIEQAAAVPRVGPPSGPLDERFVGANDQPVVAFCDENGCVQTQWYLFRCKVDQAWQKTNAVGEGLSGKGVVIADIDWGFNPNHQDLRDQIKLTQSVFPNAISPVNVANGSRCHHGTAVLGIAGAQLNTQGIVGVAFGADLWAIQAGLDDIEDHSAWVAGMDFVRTQTDQARRVIILEVETILGGNIEMIPSIAHEIREAINNRIVVCVPAGNRGLDAGIGDDNIPIPATGSILVGATRFDPLDNIRIGNGGCRVVVYAPGDLSIDVTCGLPDNGYVAGFGGTSSAVAKVAGVAALMLEKNPTLTHEQVRDILSRSQIRVVDDFSNPVGVLVDADQAVSAACHPVAPHY